MSMIKEVMGSLTSFKILNLENFIKEILKTMELNYYSKRRFTGFLANNVIN